MRRPGEPQQRGGGTIARAQATATITDDDSAATTPAVVGPVPFYWARHGNGANRCTFHSLPANPHVSLVTPQILVADGTYLGFDVNAINGAAGRPITIQAQVHGPG